MFAVSVCGLAVLLCSTPAPLAADAALDDYNLAVGLYKQKRWELSAESFRKFAQKYPQHEKLPLARLYLGLTLVNADKFADARDVLRSYLKDYPQSRNAADAMYRIAECSFLLDDFQTAESEFTTFLNANPKHELAEWALPYLGDSQLRLNKLEPAAATFQKALEQYPKGRLAEDARFGLARSYELQKKRDEAIALYKELAADKTSARAAQAQLNLAACYFDLSKYAEAAKEYDRLIQDFPASSLVPLAQLNAGYSYYQIGEYQKAIGQFDLAAADAKQAVAAGYWKGVSLKSLGQFAAAAAELKKSFEGGPTGPMAEQALFQWADCELRAGRHDAARSAFLDLVTRFPQGEFADDSLHFAAESALLSGQLDEAEKLLGRFGSEFGTSPLRLHQLVLRGRLHDARGREFDAQGNAKEAQARFQSAIADFEKVATESKLPRTVALARFHLARTLQKLGDHAKAAEALGPLVEFVNKDDNAKEFVEALVMLGRSQQALGKNQQAIASMSRYLALRPNGEQADQALSTRALAHASLGGNQQAEADLRALLLDHPNSALVGSTAQQLAEQAFAAKDWAEAGKLFTVLVNAEPKVRYRAAGLSGRAWSNYQQQKFSDAEQDFRLILMEHADDSLAPEALYMQGECLKESGKADDAVKTFAQAFEKFAPTEPAAPGAEDKGPSRFGYLAGLSAARVLRSQKKIAEADAAYERVASRFPKAKQLDLVLNEWAFLNFDMNNFVRADEIFRRLVNDYPHSAFADNAQLSLGESLLESGRLDDAAKSFRELASNPAADDLVREVSRFHLTGIDVEQRKWKEAVVDASEFVKSFPQSTRRPEMEFYLAEAQLHERKFDEARTLLAKLKGEISAKPAADSPAWQSRVWVLLAEVSLQIAESGDRKEYDSVAAAVEELRRRAPKSPWLYQADEILGRAYKNQAKFDDARAAFQRVIDHPAGSKTETAAKSQFLIAETYLLQEKFIDAQEAYLRVYHLYKFPDWQAPALFQAAACDEKLNQWANAVKTYEELIREFTTHEFAAKAKSRLDVARTKAAG